MEEWELIAEKEKFDRQVRLAKENIATNSYAVNFRCLNCGFHNEITIPRGQLVRKTACPKCGLAPCEVD